MSTNGIITNGGLAVPNSDQDEASSEAGSEVIDTGVKVWRLVLTGGPCGGKTTAQVSLKHQSYSLKILF